MGGWILYSPVSVKCTVLRGWGMETVQSRADCTLLYAWGMETVQSCVDCTVLCNIYSPVWVETVQSCVGGLFSPVWMGVETVQPCVNGGGDFIVLRERTVQSCVDCTVLCGRAVQFSVGGRTVLCVCVCVCVCVWTVQSCVGGL